MKSLLSRWVEISSNQYFTTYADKKTLQASGTAQNGRVDGYFKVVLTPIGSQKIGNESGGAVKPDVITYVLFKAWYGVNRYGTSQGGRNYYNIYGDLIYEGRLWDMEYSKMRKCALMILANIFQTRNTKRLKIGYLRLLVGIIRIDLMRGTHPGAFYISGT